MGQGTTMFLARAILKSLGEANDALGTTGDELYMSLHTGDPVSAGGTDVIFTNCISELTTGTLPGNYQNELLEFTLTDSGTGAEQNPTSPTAGSASVLDSDAVPESAFCSAGDGVITYDATVTHFAIHKCALPTACNDANVIVTGELTATLSSDDKITLNAVTFSLVSTNKQI